MSCLSDDEIADWLDGRVSGTAALDLTRHLDRCPACSALVAASARALDEEAAAPSNYSAGERLGRYVICEVIGVGATGVVYAAGDEQLGRKVALKVLRRDSFGLDGEPGRELLLREAQALARLSHPNVVAVYDAAVIADQVVIAMELVDGVTLRAWLAETPRRTQEIRDVLAQAARGLAAAHQAGLVHRDVKPENVLVGRDGRVRVSDFGLARAHGERLAPATSTTTMAVTATRTGILIGTPAYMPPEQLDGKPLDARSDLFAFAVMAWEALFGARPFAGDDANELRAAIVARPPSLPRSRLLPGGLKRALTRALAADADARPPSLLPLLTALEPRSPLAVARGLVAVVALVAAATALLIVRAQSSRCSGAARAWGEVWNAAERDVARAAFARAPDGSALFAAVERALLAYADRWIAAHRSVCEAHQHGEISSAALDRRMQCLADDRREVAALARLFTTPDQRTLDHALAAVHELPPLERCQSDRLTAAAPPLSPDEQHHHEGVAAAVAEAHALFQTGRFDECITRARASQSEAEQHDTAELGRLLYNLALCVEARDYDNAIALQHDAAIASARAHDRYTQALAWIRLVFLYGARLRRADESDLWRRYTEALLLDLDDTHLTARLLRNAGVVALRLGRMGRAAAELDKAAALAARFGPDSYDARQVATLQSSLWLDGGWPERAIIAERHELEQVEAEMGHDSYLTWWPLSNLVTALSLAGRADEALALAPRLRAVTDRYPQLGHAAWTHGRMAEALRAHGDAPAALVEDEQSVALCREAPQDVDCQIANLGLGKTLLLLGRAAEAVPALESALADTPEGAQDQDSADIVFALARALWQSGGDRARAWRLALRARAQLKVLAGQLHGPAVESQLRVVEAWLAGHQQRKALTGVVREQ